MAPADNDELMGILDERNEARRLAAIKSHVWRLWVERTQAEVNAEAEEDDHKLLFGDPSASPKIGGILDRGRRR